MKFTLLIALLNDAACAQIRKGDSDDLSDHHSLRAHIRTPRSDRLVENQDQPAEDANHVLIFKAEK